TRFKCDWSSDVCSSDLPATGKKDIIVSLHSDADARPHEHEQMHRRLVDRLIEGGILKAEEAGKVVVERQEEAKAPPTPATEPPQIGRAACRGRAASREG